jgi:hypothetical protein
MDSRMDALDRLVTRWGSVATLVATAATVIPFVGGLLDEVRDFPWYFEVPVFLFGSALFVILVARLGIYLRHRRKYPGMPEAAVKQTVVHMEEGASMGRGRVERNVQVVELGGGTTPTRRRVVRLTEAQQKELAARGRDLAKRIAAFAAERRLARREPRFSGSSGGETEQERDEAWDRKMEEMDQHNAETDAGYQRLFVNEIAEYLDEAVEAGFELDRELRRYMDMAGPAWTEEAGMQIQVLAGRIERYKPPWWRRWRSSLTSRSGDSQGGEP